MATPHNHPYKVAQRASRVQQIRFLSGAPGSVLSTDGRKVYTTDRRGVCTVKLAPGKIVEG